MEKADIESGIREQEARLRASHPRLTRCQVNIEDRPPHRYERKRFNVRLDLALDDRALVINREHDEDAAAALGAAFDAANRELQALEAGLGSVPPENGG